MVEFEPSPPRSASVIIGGGVSVFFGIFHLAFWHLFDWRMTLASLSPFDRAVMQVLNVHVAYTILAFGSLSLFLSRELLGTRLGRWLGVCVAGFWILRALNEVAFFQSPPSHAVAMVAVCVGMALLYAVPLWRWRRGTPEARP